MMSLQEVTGQESGIVIYEGDGVTPEAVVCNWSSVQGFPRVDPLGLAVLGFGEDIPERKGTRSDDIPSLMAGVQIVYAHGEDMPQSGTVFDFGDGVTVICPDDWN